MQEGRRKTNKTQSHEDVIWRSFLKAKVQAQKEPTALSMPIAEGQAHCLQNHSLIPNQPTQLLNQSVSRGHEAHKTLAHSSKTNRREKSGDIL